MLKLYIAINIIKMDTGIGRIGMEKLTKTDLADMLMYGQLRSCRICRHRDTEPLTKCVYCLADSLETDEYTGWEWDGKK